MYTRGTFSALGFGGSLSRSSKALIGAGHNNLDDRVMSYNNHFIIHHIIFFFYYCFCYHIIIHHTIVDMLVKT